MIVTGFVAARPEPLSLAVPLNVKLAFLYWFPAPTPVSVRVGLVASTLTIAEATVSAADDESLKLVETAPFSSTAAM